MAKKIPINFEEVNKIQKKDCNFKLNKKLKFKIVIITLLGSFVLAALCILASHYNIIPLKNGKHDEQYGQVEKYDNKKEKYDKEYAFLKGKTFYEEYFPDESGIEPLITYEKLIINDNFDFYYEAKYFNNHVTTKIGSLYDCRISKIEDNEILFVYYDKNIKEDYILGSFKIK